MYGYRSGDNAGVEAGATSRDWGDGRLGDGDHLRVRVRVRVK